MSPSAVLWRLLMLFRPYWGWMALGIFISLITVLANVSLLALAGWFIAAMAIAGLAQVDMNYFTPAAAIRGLAMLRIASRYGERLISHAATLRLLAQLRVWFYNRLEPLSPAILQSYQSGDLLSRIRADIDTLENFYLRIFSPFVVALLGTLIYILFLLRYDPRLALVEGLLLALAGVALPLFINRLSQKPGQRIVATRTRLRAHAIDSVQGMAELLVYQADQQQQQHLNDLTENLLADQQRMASYRGISQAGISLAANLAMWLVLLIALPLVSTQQLAPASLAMLALFVLASFEMIMPLPLAFQLLPETLAAARRIFTLADTEPLIQDPDTPAPPPRHLDIRFQGVSFRYRPEQPPVLQNFNASIPQGRKIGIVGPSGSGKSSLVNILLRFWPIQAGTVTLGDLPLTAYSGDALRQYFSVVSQQPHLFNSTVRANLLLAKPEASDAEIRRVCQVAQLDEFIQQLPDGYDTWIGEAGTRLSGGQAQRLAIARALLKDAPILILDEPFEGIDALLEQQLIQAVFSACEGKTVLYITHKQAGLEWMDEVITLAG